MSPNNSGPNGPNEKSANSKAASKAAKPTTKGLAKVALARVGRDEMNLAEYTFASFRREVQKNSVTERKWIVPDPNYPDRDLEASWRVAGDPELGRPTATDVEVYLVLMEMTRESDWQQEVSFSTLQLLQKLGWSPNSKHYNMLRASFARLKAVSITARNCFWDNQGRLVKGQTGFSIIDNYHIDETVGRKTKEPSNQGQLALSWWKWNDVIYTSMRANYVKPIDLDFALSLRARPLALGLFRYLDKKRWSKGRPKPAFTIGIRKLCEQHLQLADTRHISTMKRTLQPAHDDLLSRGFLVSVDYEPLKDGSGERIIYRFSKAPAKTQPKPSFAGPDGGTFAPETQAQIAAREAAESAWRERVMQATFEFLQKDDIEDFERLHNDAVSDLGEMDSAMLARDPESAPVLRTIRENMWAMVEIEYPWMISDVEEKLKREGDTHG